MLTSVRHTVPGKLLVNSCSKLQSYVASALTPFCHLLYTRAPTAAIARISCAAAAGGPAKSLHSPPGLVMRQENPHMLQEPDGTNRIISGALDGRTRAFYISMLSKFYCFITHDMHKCGDFIGPSRGGACTTEQTNIRVSPGTTSAMKLHTPNTTPREADVDMIHHLLSRCI
jgi:hypothetical protein